MSNEKTMREAFSRLVADGQLIGYHDFCAGYECAVAEAAVRAEREGAVPVAFLIDWPDEPGLGHYFAEASCETGRSRPLYLHPPQAGATVPNPPAAFAGEELVAIPKGLIGAACSAIDKKRDGKNLLAELRRYTVGDLSTAISCATVAEADALTYVRAYIEEREDWDGAEPLLADIDRFIAAAPSRPGDEKEAQR